MTIAFLATGDELVYGDTLNTNSHALAKSLRSDGLPTGLQLTCSDDEQEMVDCLHFLSRAHHTIILTGGLGPTSDDRTRYALSRFLNIPLIDYPEALAYVDTCLQRANLKMHAGHHQQALFPKQAILLPNPNGTAMGCYLSVDNARYILLPGPPRECLPMFHQYVLPKLRQELLPAQTQILKWRLFGVAEGEISRRLDAALNDIDCETGYRLETPYVEFKVRCRPDLVLIIQHIIDPLVAPFIIAPPEQKASELLRLAIEKQHPSIAIVDEVTGGVLQTLLQRPGCGAKTLFRDDALSPYYFHLTGLDAYWQQDAVTNTEVRIAYRIHGVEGVELHQLPFRSPQTMQLLAAEWLSFRLLHLINQLHESVR
jgi:nicotinamide-nucleotide amidase